MVGLNPFTANIPPFLPTEKESRAGKIRRVQSIMMELSSFARDYLKPAPPPGWVELVRLMGSWHLNDTEDLEAYFNQRFPQHGAAILEAKDDLEKWMASVHAKLSFSNYEEGIALKKQEDRIAGMLEKTRTVMDIGGIR